MFLLLGVLFLSIWRSDETPIEWQVSKTVNTMTKQTILAGPSKEAEINQIKSNHVFCYVDGKQTELSGVPSARAS